ncbi:MAG: hypothetical protein MI892_08630 [Desulfobacterales bacterium]|nr:hypothetical protein [Desulfobacterales bacterium]
MLKMTNSSPPPPVKNAQLQDDAKLRNTASAIQNNSSFALMTMTPMEKMISYQTERFEEDEIEDLPPVENVTRKCTDCLCLLLLFAYWLAMLGISAFAISEGVC